MLHPHVGRWNDGATGSGAVRTRSMRARTLVGSHTATTAAAPLGPLATAAMAAAVVSFVFVFVFVFVFSFSFIFIFIVVLIGLRTILGDQGHHAHPRRDRPLERRGANFHGEHRPHANHQQREHGAHNERNKPDTTIHGKAL